MSTGVAEAVLIEVEGHHSAFPISLELLQLEHEDGSDSVSDDNRNSTTQERFIHATPKDYDNFLSTNICKKKKQLKNLYHPYSTCVPEKTWSTDKNNTFHQLEWYV